MSTAEKPPANFHSVAYYPAFAMLTYRSHSLDGAFEAVEGVASACSNQFETLVVFVSANFTGRHSKFLSMDMTGCRSSRRSWQVQISCRHSPSVITSKVARRKSPSRIRFSARPSSHGAVGSPLTAVTIAHHIAYR